MGAKYQITVGRKREGNNAVAGFLEKGRNDIIRGEAKEVAIRVGAFGIPNGTEAWGVRLDKSGKVPDAPLNAEDPEYRGEIKWLKWGEKGGTMIKCRYVSGHTTIDREYQKLRLKIDELPDSDPYAALITLVHGYNELDEDRDKGLIQMLKVHHHNDKSISCNPNSEGWMYTEIRQEELDKEKTKTIDEKFACILMVNQASSKPESIKNLFDIVKGVESAKINRDDASEVYTHLKHFADQQPELFSQRLTAYKTAISNVFEKAKSFDLIDTTKDGVIAAGDKKKDIILENIPVKGKDALDWAFTNFLEPEVFEGIDKLKKITEKIK